MGIGLGRRQLYEGMHLDKHYIFKETTYRQPSGWRTA